jgi:hypothetical protein
MRTYGLRTKSIIAGSSALLAAATFQVQSAQAGWMDKLDFHGSLGEGGFEHYVPPLSNPLFNETPYITTEIRAIQLHNDIPEKFLTQGGNIDIYAAEVRLALTDRLGIIATKDGYVDADFDRVLPDKTGWANISLGLKYAVISRPKEGEILTLGFEYEPPSGSLNVVGIKMQGDGDGFIDIFATGAKTMGKLGLQASMGANLALDADHDSSMFHYSLHADYEILPNFYPLVEMNGFTKIDEGNRTGIMVEGMDLINFGSVDSGTVITFAGGARYKFNNHLQLGAGYEMPITDRKDIMDWRTYVDLVISY